MTERRQPSNMVSIALRVPPSMYNALLAAVDAGRYTSLSEAVRDAIRKIIQHYETKG